MSEVHEIEAAILRLSPEALAKFREWYAEFDADLWDRQIERDADRGCLDGMATEALRDLNEGRCTDL